MSDSKPAGEVVFRVVDKCGGRHFVAAVRMANDCGFVTFHDKSGAKVGHFVDPVGVVLASSCTPFSPVDLTPGAAVRTWRPRWGRLDWLMFGALTINAALMAYDQFVKPLV